MFFHLAFVDLGTAGLNVKLAFDFIKFAGIEMKVAGTSKNNFVR
jgi:dihydroxyacetone kinase DhaKLM complex PTS-EIIA-like component DhaM